MLFKYRNYLILAAFLLVLCGFIFLIIKYFLSNEYNTKYPERTSELPFKVDFREKNKNFPKSFWLLTSVSVYAQKKYGGLYEGTFMEQKCLLSLKISNGAAVGTLYTGRNTSHSVMGTFENGQLNAILHHKMLGNAELIGSFADDKLIADVLFLNQAVPLRLEQKSKSTEINFDKYFGKPSLDFNLVGSWKVIYQISYENKNVSSHTKKHFFKDGNMRIDGMKLNIKGKTLPPEFSWFTSEKHLYITMSVNGQSITEINYGKWLCCMARKTLIFDKG